MTKKDYIVIAELLDIISEELLLPLSQKQKLGYITARYLKQVYRNFDKFQFLHYYLSNYV